MDPNKRQRSSRWGNPSSKQPESTTNRNSQATVQLPKPSQPSAVPARPTSIFSSLTSPQGAKTSFDSLKTTPGSIHPVNPSRETNPAAATTPFSSLISNQQTTTALSTPTASITTSTTPTNITTKAPSSVFSSLVQPPPAPPHASAFSALIPPSSTTVLSPNATIPSHNGATTTLAVSSTDKSTGESREAMGFIPQTIYLDEEAFAAFTPTTFDQAGNSLDAAGNIVKLAPKQQSSTIDVERDISRDNIDSISQLRKRKQPSTDVILPSDDMTGKDTIITTGKATTTTTTTLNDGEKKPNIYSIDLNDISTRNRSTRRGILGDAVDIVQVKRANQLATITRLERETKQYLHSQQEQDFLQYRCAIDWSSTIFGTPFITPENPLETNLNGIKNPTKPLDVFAFQQYMYPFETNNVPMEWWDLKNLCTGQQCVDDLHQRLEQQQQEQQQQQQQQQPSQDQNDTMMEATQSNTTATASKTPSPPAAPAAVLLRPAYPIYNQNTHQLDIPTKHSSPHTLNTIPYPNMQVISAAKMSSPDQLDSIWPFSSILSSNVISTMLYYPKTQPLAPAVLAQQQLDESITLILPQTKQEAKKLRKQQRHEAREQEQLEIKLGLRQKEQQKIRPATLERQMAHFEAFGAPTELYQKALAQIQGRIMQHVQNNIANMLTPEQRRDKRLQKILSEQAQIEDGQQLLETRVYRVGTLNSPLTRKNIIMNAKQQRLTGVVLLCQNAVNLIIVEGGRRGLKKFDTVISRRLKYEDTGNIGANILQQHEPVDNDDDNDDDMNEHRSEKQDDRAIKKSSSDNDDDNDNDNDDTQDGDDTSKREKKIRVPVEEYLDSVDSSFGCSPHDDCILVWTGQFKQRMFEQFQLRKTANLFHLKKVLQKQGLENIYDAMLSYL